MAVPVEFDGIDHVVLRVMDIERSLRFYVDVLGMSLERVLTYVNLYQLRCGRNLIDLIALPPGASLPEREQRGVDHVCLNIRGDIDAIVESLKGHGVPITMEPTELYGATGFGTSIYILDPDGYALELKANYSKRPVRFTTPPQKAASSSTQATFSATAGRSRYVTFDGMRFHYVEWGAAGSPPMVLLHGLRGYAHWFDEFAEVAEAEYRLFALDQRGRGETDWAPDGVYTTDAYVGDLERFVDHLGLTQFILVGHSMGATNAINYAARHPERVRALLILEIAPEVSPVGLQRIRRELANTPKEFDSWEAARAFLRTLHTKPSEQHIRTRLHWMLKEQANGKLVWRLDGAIFDPKVSPDPPERNWSLLKEIRCPALVVRGGVSDLITREIVDRMVQTIPGSRTVDIPDAGHMVLEDNPAAFNQAVMEFLRGLPCAR